MLYRVTDAGELVKVQLDSTPACSRFNQAIVSDGDRDANATIRVTYMGTEDVPAPEDKRNTIDVPLHPNVKNLEQQDVDLHRSMVSAYCMGDEYDAWFSECFGFSVRLFYIGDQRRPVLGTFAPQSESSEQPANKNKGWLATLSNYVVGTNSDDSGPEPYWLGFSDMAPYLVTTQASLRNVSARFTTDKNGGGVDMLKFRPNIVVDGEAEFDEDFWAELTVANRPTFTMTKMCNRCTSLNVDYDTGRTAVGEPGTLLKKLMSDRRVDTGHKYSPVFGHYAFLATERDGTELYIRVDDPVSVTKRLAERPVWDWPGKNKVSGRFYRY